ncbi:Glycogen debranching enzyme (alpha-1,6-glucosidase) [Thermanaeromonas toyohensis ToBE]|uniref:Glycogen debranching enzyme (Alpha-1,6-glucosidase) n=1 Tax=Thermanaeromonas toyohensis ToBE TaxID=698762 RepID=A0A1W1VZF2_9FIRM|nr:amylo-alpha-1,6-glucosidase [Thermanaeromonas toyohensis]SMB98630.1 Glycogen debranching enzyme (alpha-1,6-glucosidase) [Thermanaeromonas toyohensis ToBE]
MEYLVVKDNGLFFLADPTGEVPKEDGSTLGLYTRDTRFLDRMECYINGQKPLLLTLKHENNAINALLTNRPLSIAQGMLPEGSLLIRKRLFISQGVLYVQVILRNYYRDSLSFTLDLYLSADFKDLFEVRGYIPSQRVRNLTVSSSERELVFRYHGADGLFRQTEINFEPAPSSLSPEGKASYRISLPSGGTFAVHLFITPVIEGEKRPCRVNISRALRDLRSPSKQWVQPCTEIITDNPDFNQWIEQSLQDLGTLMVDFGEGLFPVAGVPWFAVPFGRDSLITALQTLILNPAIALSILKTLAKYQGKKIDPWRDEQPGKIPHEIRWGELANTGQIPHTPYYGTVDATPLFLILLSEYYDWTGDTSFLRELLPAASKALEWIDEYGDRDGDGFVEYLKESPLGIENQGWKDSEGAIVHRSGELARAPIALAEVQGYVYDAKVRWAFILEKLGEVAQSRRLRESARQLKQAFRQAFWMEDAQFIALALDKDKQRVETVASNAGHCLWSGLLDKKNASQVVRRLLAPDMFSGYGIRTMSSKARAYNPLSYHNGSVWPHDNSLIVMGFTRYGFRQEANQVIEGLLQAAKHFNYRLPELFCGFSRDKGGPVPYPTACAPQSWAAGTVFLLIQALLGLFPRASQGQLYLDPVLPESLSHLEIRNLRVGEGILDLLIKREGHQYQWELGCNTSGLEVVRGNLVTAA